MRLLGVLVALPLAAACSDGDGSPADARADQVREAVLDAGLPDDVADVIALAARGADGTFRVTYEIEGRAVVITQRPPDRRIEGVDDDGTADATITVDGRTHACTDPPGDDEGWRCEALGEPPAPGTFDDDAVDELVRQLTAAADSHDFSVEDREVAGTDARCLVTTPRPGAEATDPAAPGALCVADSGAILLVERPAGTLRATGYTTDVPDDAFELPA